MQFPRSSIPLFVCVALAACNAQQPGTGPDTDNGADSSGGASEANTSPEPGPTDTVSILRPELQGAPGDAAAELVGPLDVVIGFPQGGNQLDGDAIAALKKVLESDQVALGRPISLRAHGDSSGSFDANQKASEKRGLAVKKWLTDQGIDADRITIIAFGGQNPVKPNALPDGSPNEAGRAANRRVEIAIEGEQTNSPAEEMVEEAEQDAASSKTGN